MAKASKLFSTDRLSSEAKIKHLKTKIKMMKTFKNAVNLINLILIICNHHNLFDHSFNKNLIFYGILADI